MTVSETAPGDPTGSPGWGQTARGETVLGETTRSEALEILRDVLEWRLPPARWVGVAQIVRSMAVAVDAGDSGALREATAELELESPLRVTRAGSTTPVPPPEQVREPTIRLTKSIEGQEPPGGATRDDGSGHDDGPSRP